MPSRSSIPKPEQIGEDTPLRLDIAAAIAFPGGLMNAMTLRAEHRQRRLTIERIAGRDFTTLGYISQMKLLWRQRCLPGAGVYVVGFDRFVKIGWSSRIKTRIRDLGMAVPEELLIYATLKGPITLERLLHRRFKQLRLRGEWFRFDAELKAWIEEGCPL